MRLTLAPRGDTPRVPSAWSSTFSHAALAQLVEHFIRNEGVVGSTPMGGSTFCSLTLARQSPILASIQLGRIDDSNSL